MILSKASLFIKLISLHAKKTIENNVKNDRLEVSFSTKNDLERTTPFVENERTFRFFVLALFGTKTNGGTFSKSRDDTQNREEAESQKPR